MFTLTVSATVYSTLTDTVTDSVTDTVTVTFISLHLTCNIASRTPVLYLLERSTI